MMHITDNTPDLKNYHLAHITSCFNSVNYVKKLNNSQPL